MLSRKALLLALAGLFTVTAVLWFARPAGQQPAPVGAAQPDVPETIQLTGIVRDFPKSHPDFDAVPSGPGHFAGTVGVWLPGTGRPNLETGGFQVDEQWRDSEGRPIAPHLFNTLGTGNNGESLGVRVNGRIKIDEACQVDAFNSSYGPYGVRGNYGSGAIVSTNAVGSASKGKGKLKNPVVHIKKQSRIFGDVFVGPGGDPARAIRKEGSVTGTTGALTEVYEMPFVVPPPPGDVGPLLGDVTWDNETVTLTGDLDSDDDVSPPAMLYGKLEIKDRAVVHVEGDLVVICTRLKIGKDSEVVLAPGANLTLYVIGNHPLEIEKSLLNVGLTAADPTSLTINYLGDDKIKIKESHVYAVILSPMPDSVLELDKGHLYGGYIGEELKLKKNSAIHVDAAIGIDPYNPAITVMDKIEGDDSDIDGFDSNAGPYDENATIDALLITNSTGKGKVKAKKGCYWQTNILVGPGADAEKVVKIEGNSTVTGFKGSLAEHSPIPAVTPPYVAPGSGDVEYKGGTHVISEDVRCKKMKIEDKAVVQIVGDVTIRCDDKFEMKKKSEVQLMPGASLTLYVQKELKIEDKCLFNMNTGDPQLASIRRLSIGKKGKIEIKKQSLVSAWIQGPKTELKIEDKSELFGTFIGQKLKLKKSELHVDMAYFNICGDVNDIAGTAGAEGNGGITSESTFGQWFRDDPTVNQSTIHKITLTHAGNGVYELLSNDFHPVDGRLLGNEGDANNNHFTYVINADFVYQACDGQFVEFQGGDGAWIYIDGNLALDLGGLRSAETQYVELDRLGLSPDVPHTFTLFYAQRDRTSHTFRLRTNVRLSTDRFVPNVTAQYD